MRRAARQRRHPLRGWRPERAADRRRRRPGADQHRQQLLAAGGDRDLEHGARHAAPPAHLADHRQAAIPRAGAANLPGFRVRPRVHRQPVPGRQRAAQFRGALRILFRPQPADHGSPASTRGSTNPIEAAAFFAGGGQLRVGFANAPEAELYGAEIEAQVHIPLDGLGGPFFDTRRLLLHRQLHLHPVEHLARTTARSSARICNRSRRTCCSRTARG